MGERWQRHFQSFWQFLYTSASLHLRRNPIGHPIQHMALETPGQRHTDDTKCHLLDLTPELRTYIFEQALVSDDYVSHDFSQMDCASDNNGYDQKIKSTQPPLTRVNRQTRAETLSIYYSLNKFLAWAEDADGRARCTKWLHAIGNSIQFIRKLRIDVGEKLVFVDIKVDPGGRKTHEFCLADELRADSMFTSLCRPDHDTCLCPYIEHVRQFSTKHSSGFITLQELDSLGDLLWNEAPDVELFQEEMLSILSGSHGI